MDWHGETLYSNPWVASQVVNYGDEDLCYILELWLGGEELPIDVDAAPFVEEEKVKNLQRLHRALNR